jgi:hypothetical protein
MRGQDNTHQGRFYIVALLDAGSKPKTIALSINLQRRKNNDRICSLFTEDITASRIRNIRSYENQKKRNNAGTGHEYMLDRNAGLLEYGCKKSFDLPRYLEVRQVLHDLLLAEDVAEHKLLMAKLRRHPLANEMFVVGVCKDEDGRVLGLVLSNALIFANIEQSIRAFGLNNINVAVDGTYELSKIGWALITMATHSIEMHEDSVLSQKIRPLMYMYSTSESTVVFVYLIRAFKRMVLELFGHVVDSLDVAAFDQCQAALKAFSDENKNLKPVLDWTQVIMNVKRVLLRIFNKDAVSALTRLYEDSCSASTAPETEAEEDEHAGTLSDDLYENLREDSRPGRVNIQNVYINRMMDDVRDLHKARNLQQFTFLSHLKMNKWRDAYSQPDAAKWFADTYLVPQWRCWFVSASGTPGVSPSTQHLESLHNRMKNTDLPHLRSTIEDLMASILQDLLSNHADRKSVV